MRRLARTATVVGFVTLLGGGSAFGQWPQWGGPNRDFKADVKSLSTDWPADGPKRAWSRSLGDGYSSIVIDGSRLFTMYRSGDDEIVVAMRTDNGKTIWEHKYAAPIADGIEKRFGVGPRSTPTVAGDRVYTIGITGKLHCLSKADGKPIWSHDLMAEFQAKPPGFGFASSPLAYKNMLIVVGGGKGCGMIAFDLASGSVMWRKHDFENVYSSPVLIRPNGEDQVVLLVDREIVGVAPKTGDLLWRHAHENQWKTNISTPVWNDQGVLFVSSGGDAGSRALKITRSDGKTNVKELWTSRKASVGQGNMVRVGDHLYGCAGHGPNSFLAAVDARTGETTWKQRGFKQGSMVFAAGKLLILDEDGTLSMVDASPAAFKLITSCKLFDDRSWTIPTIVGKKLYARNNKTIVALDLG